MTEPWLRPFVEHGGCRQRAAAYYRLPVERWTNLSTGINPSAWPVGDIPREVWARLPEEEDGLAEVMQSYFGTSAVLAVAGSQSAISALPRLRMPGRVAVRAPTYAEHAKAWLGAGHTVVSLEAAEDGVEPLLDSIDVLVVVNPNNPTGTSLSPSTLLRWHARLSQHDGWLVVDETFVDPTPDASVATYADRHLIVLRSLGKFWGLAGVRLGFVLAASELLAALRVHLGPWHVSHPARFIARGALADHPWMEATRLRLRQDSNRLAMLLASHGLYSPAGCLLFRWVPTRTAARLFDTLARRGVLVRAFPQFGGVRFGLPGCESGWRKLGTALRDLPAEVRP